jgi:hypothetical protein
LLTGILWLCASSFAHVTDAGSFDLAPIPPAETFTGKSESDLSWLLTSPQAMEDFHRDLSILCDGEPLALAAHQSTSASRDRIAGALEFDLISVTTHGVEHTGLAEEQRGNGFDGQSFARVLPLTDARQVPYRIGRSVWNRMDVSAFQKPLVVAILLVVTLIVRRRAIYRGG